jgi:hypothetical protein
MPVIDALSDKGKKQDADMLSAKMMEMADSADGLAAGSDKIAPGGRKHECDKYGESDWNSLLHRYWHDWLLLLNVQIIIIYLIAYFFYNSLYVA